MPYTLEDLRTQVRSVLLDDEIPDEDGNHKFSDDRLKFAVEWGLEQLANHTALPKMYTFTDLSSKDYNLPDDLFTADKFDQCSEVTLIDGNSVESILDPVRYTSNLDRYRSNGYYTYPDNVLHLTELPTTYSTLRVRYFAFYPNPIAPTDEITLPRHLKMALSYLVAVHALSGASTASSLIRQWNTKKDSGNPENNVILEQQKQYLKMYTEEMLKHQAQDRYNHFRVSEGDD